MKIDNMKLEEIRERYGKEKGDFFIRIREQGNDIVYYNGIKAFEIRKNGEKVSKIIIADNIFNLNRTNIQNFTKNTEDLKSAIKQVRKDLNGYFPRELNKITLEISRKNYENVEMNDKNREKFSDSIERIKKIVETNYRNYIEDKLDKEKIKEELNKKYENNEKLTYEIYLKNRRDIKEYKEDSYIEKIVDIEYDFINCFIFDENINYIPLFTIPKFKYKNNEEIQIGKEEYEKFEEIIKQAIEDYEKKTKVEKEKKYQHIFMTSEILINKYITFKNIYRFEEEYYTKEKSKKDRGRIDCIFVKIDENSKVINEDKPNAELYLIELKVDEGVIGGSNGVNKHLNDIEKLKANEEKFDDFINLLQERIAYRKSYIESKNIKIKIDRDNIHFWTIIAISKKESVEEVANMLYKNLENPKYIEDKRNKLPEESVVLSEQIKKVKDMGIDVKFLFDKWNDKMNYNKLSNKYLFEAKTPEELLSKWKEE